MAKGSTQGSFDPTPVGGELPPQPKSRRGQPPVYLSRLEVIRGKVKADAELAGEWWPVNHFKSSRGAASAIRSIKNGTIEIPPGKWEFDSRQMAEGCSTMYARFTPQRRKAAKP